MKKFSQFLNERAPEGEMPSVGDVQEKIALVKNAWNELKGVVDYFNKALPKLPPEVVPDFLEQFSEALSSWSKSRPMQLNDKSLDYLIHIIMGNNRFSKSTYLKSWPNNPPEWWTGSPWNKNQ